MKNENEYFYSRNIDTNGRFVLPKEVRDRYGIVDGTPLIVSMEGDRIIVKVATPICFICGAMENLISLKGKNVCNECLEKLNEIKKLNE